MGYYIADLDWRAFHLRPPSVTRLQWYVVLELIAVGLAWDFQDSGVLAGLFTVLAVLLLWRLVGIAITYVMYKRAVGIVNVPVRTMDIGGETYTYTGYGGVTINGDDEQVPHGYIIGPMSGVMACHARNLQTGSECIFHNLTSQEMVTEDVQEFIDEHVESEIHELVHWALDTDENNQVDWVGDEMSPHAPRWNKVIRDEMEYITERDVPTPIRTMPDAASERMYKRIQSRQSQF